MAPVDQAQPPAKWGKYAAYSIPEKIWLLDYGKQNPKVSAEDLGKALAAEVNAEVPEIQKQSAPG